MVYNIYLNSPQLAYNANIKKYNKYVINKNNLLFNKKYEHYTPIYFYTGYSRIKKPNLIINSY
jgi:hypothetical protein